MCVPELNAIALDSLSSFIAMIKHIYLGIQAEQSKRMHSRLQMLFDGRHPYTFIVHSIHGSKMLTNISELRFMQPAKLYI